MVAFAGNSLLCRLALGSHAIDPVSFSTVRFGSGALALLVLSVLSGSPVRGGSWRAAAVLFVYAFPFASAYTQLTTGLGALIMFGAVQLTMIARGLLAGEQPSPLEWTGLLAASGGLVWLVFPGLASSPAPQGVLLMTVAGVAWGVYSLLGRFAANPVATTTGTFVRLVPALLVTSALTATSAHANREGVMLAAVSGAVTSAGGYVVWYQALRHLSATRAAILQLSVPALAALGGVVILGEPLTIRLLSGAALILGGVSLSIVQRARAGLPPRAAADRGQ